MLALSRRLTLLVVMSCAAAAAWAGVEPPVAERRPVSVTVNNDTRVDEYGWLRNKEDAATIAYLEAENAYAEAKTAHTASLRDTLYNEFVGRIKQTDLSVPWRKGEYYYYSRTEEGKSYPIYCRKHGSLDAPEQVMLDVNELAEGKEYLRLTAWAVSPDHRLLAYATDETGYERVTIRVMEIDTGEHLSATIEDAGTWTLEWANDNRTLFYTRMDDTNRPDRLYRRDVVGEGGAETLVFHEPDGAYFLGCDRTRSDRFLILSLGSQVTSEVWFLDADSPTGSFRVVAPRRYGVEYDVEHQGERFLIHTNDGARNFRVMSAPVSDPALANWTEVVPHDPDVYITGVDAFAGHVALSERRGGYATVRIIDTATGAQHTLETPEVVSTTYPQVNPEYNTATLRFSYSSPVTPPSVFDYDMNTRARTLLKQEEVLGGYDPSRYETNRIWATAPDGVRVPISVVHLRGLRLDGSNPCLLYGYGSYGAPANPGFNSPLVSLLDRGVVCATAHIRGGGDMGRHWYDDGKFLNKVNTFTDFIACAEALIEAGYTEPDRLAIRGGSAGGLLIGAVINMRPDLFGVAHAAVPFVDVLNTMLDASIPLTVIEYDEWGNPEDPAYYAYIKSYAPYENVRAQRYPHLLVTAGLNDPRVHYWEPAKWTARLRATKTGDEVIVLKTNMGAGHGGASGRYARLEELAYEYAFLLDRIGAGGPPIVPSVPGAH